jgi:HTH-type transcriptional regulator / antitoxin HigA
VAGAQDTQFKPDWAIHPGEMLEEYLEAYGLSQAEFARRADLTPKLVNTIIKGHNPVEADTALALERVTGTRAYIWTGLQKEWELYRSRVAERSQHDSNAVKNWLSLFPVKELQQRGVLPPSNDLHGLRESLLAFLGVANEHAFAGLNQRYAVRYRASKAFRSSPECVHVWLQLATRAAEEMDVAEFSDAQLVDALAEIRQLTKLAPREFQPRVTALCAAAGVAIVPVPPFKNTKLNGAAFWYARNKAAVVLSLRHRTNDHFWFTLFHELGHLCLHGRDTAYVDDDKPESDPAEAEADAWAEEKLVGRARLHAFMAGQPRAKAEVRHFAASVGIHPGIVVGMLQHHGVLPWTHMNDLKDRFVFASES